MRKVEACAEADLENGALHVFEASRSLILHRLRVHGDVEDVRENAVFVDAHATQLTTCRVHQTVPSPEPTITGPERRTHPPQRRTKGRQRDALGLEGEPFRC